MTISANAVRYIKLGRGGRWEKVSLEKGELHFGHARIPHELALIGVLDRMKEQAIAGGRDPRTASVDAREVSEFYHLDSNCLWITFAQDHLWWTFAQQKVTWLGVGEDHGARIRKSIGGWRNSDVSGVPLRIASLSTRLTKVAGYRRTLCRIEAEDYLLRRINGVIEPLVAKSNQARGIVLDVITEAITALSWSDFETLVDVMFSRSGWHRASPLGGTQKFLDLAVEQPTTGERAAIQVKSAAAQEQLEEFVNSADEAGSFDHLFFVCHTPRASLIAPADRSDVHVWAGRDLASAALRLGLSDWIIEKVS